jgi:hypothetical protein
LNINQDSEHEEDAPMDVDGVQEVRYSPEIDTGPTPDIVEINEDDNESQKSFSFFDFSSNHTSREAPDLETLRLLSLIPQELFDPVILNQDGHWHCPIRHCPFSLNLRGTLPQLDTEDKIFLEKSFWTSRSRRVASILNKLCSCHYLDHLQQSGLVIRGVSTPFKFVHQIS